MTKNVQVVISFCTWYRALLYRAYFQYLALILIKMKRLIFIKIMEFSQGHMQMAELKHGAQSFDNCVILLNTGCYITAYQNDSKVPLRCNFHLCGIITTFWRW